MAKRLHTTLFCAPHASLDWARHSHTDKKAVHLNILEFVNYSPMNLILVEYRCENGGDTCSITWRPRTTELVNLTLDQVSFCALLFLLMVSKKIIDGAPTYHVRWPKLILLVLVLPFAVYSGVHTAFFVLLPLCHFLQLWAPQKRVRNSLLIASEHELPTFLTPSVPRYNRRL